MGKDIDAPEIPDPYATAAAQSQMNQDTAQFGQKINLIDQYTPTGSMTYTQHPTDPDRWVSNAQLTPEAQRAYDLQQQVGTDLSRTALNATNQIQQNLGTPLDFSGMPDVNTSLNLAKFIPYHLQAGPQSLDLSSLGSLPEGLDFASLGQLPQFDDDARQRAEDALYSLHSSRLDPQFERDRVALETRLANSGLQVGTEGYNDAMNRFGQEREQAYRSARDTSIAGGVGYGSQLFGTQLAGRQQGVDELTRALMSQLGIRGQGFSELSAKHQAEGDAADRLNRNLLAGLDTEMRRAQAEQAAGMSARQQGINEATYLRNLPLNEVASLLGTGQINMPQFNAPPGVSVANTDLGGMVYNSAGLAQQQYQQQMAQQNALMGGLFGLGGAALGGWGRSGFA